MTKTPYRRYTVVKLLQPQALIVELGLVQTRVVAFLIRCDRAIHDTSHDIFQAVCDFTSYRDD